MKNKIRKKAVTIGIVLATVIACLFTPFNITPAMAATSEGSFQNSNQHQKPEITDVTFLKNGVKLSPTDTLSGGDRLGVCLSFVPITGDPVNSEAYIFNCVLRDGTSRSAHVISVKGVDLTTQNVASETLNDSTISVTAYSDLLPEHFIFLN